MVDSKTVARSRARRVRDRSLWCLAALVPVGVLAACSSDDGPARPSLDADAGPEASLPETGPSTTDGPAADARGPFNPSDEPVTCGAGPCATGIVAGDDHFCARMNDGTVRCWGAADRGQLGRADVGGGSSPASVTGLTGVSQISAAGATTCARVDDGGVLCWGSNEHGQLGRDLDPPTDSEPHAVPERVAIDSAARVDVGQRSVCATTATGSAFCWGNDESAQLARGEPAGAGLPPAPAQIGAVRRTAAGLDTAFALDEAGTLLSWGAVAGPLGVLSGRVASLTPTPLASAVHGLGSVSSFAVSGLTPGRAGPDALPFDPPPPPNQHVCAISGGDVYCWGKSERGALGSGLPDPVIKLPTVAQLGTTAYAQQIAAGGENTCVRLTDGNVACTGENELGQLGTGTAGPFASTFKTAITLAGRAVQVAVAKETVCALLQDGSIACWGGNLHGELGLGTHDEEPHPSATKVPL